MDRTPTNHTNKSPRKPNPSKPNQDVRRKRKRKSKAARRRAKRLRRLILLAVIVVVIIVAIIFGIRALVGGIKHSDPAPDKTAFIVKSDGKLIYDEVEELSPEYDVGKVEAFAKSQIDSYTPPTGESVELLISKEDDGKAIIRTEYSSYKAYKDFTGYDVFYGTISEALSKGYGFNTSFKDVESKASVSREEVISDTSNLVFILQEATTVKIEGEPLYVSSEGTNVSDGEIVISSLGSGSDTAPVCYIVLQKES